MSARGELVEPFERGNEGIAVGGGSRTALTHEA